MRFRTPPPSRRRFLQGLAGASLALPWLPSLASQAGAASAGPIKRFIFVFTANGQRPENWYPTQNRDWTALGQNVRESQLDGTSDFSRIIGSAFTPLQDKLLILRGLDAVNYKVGGGHYAPFPLSSDREVKARATIDQIVASSSAVYESPPPIRSSHMLVKPKFQVHSSCSVSDSGGSLNEVPHEVSVSASYERLFGGFTSTSDPLVSERRELGIRTLDAVRDQYQALAASPKLSQEDARRLEAHAEFIHDLESRVQSSRASCEAPASVQDADLDDEMNIPDITTKNIDLLVNAIKCDRTRVCTLMLCGETDIRRSSYLPGGEAGDHHELSHSGDSDKLARINGWYGAQVADLISKLDEVEDGETGATYLDNSVVYWGNEDGCNTQDAHWGSAAPVLLAGGLGGYLKTGRYVDYREVEGPDDNLSGNRIEFNYQGSDARLTGADYRGRLYNSLLISLMEGMGLDSSEWERNGPGFGLYGPNYNSQYSEEDGRRPLPHLS